MIVCSWNHSSVKLAGRKDFWVISKEPNNEPNLRHGLFASMNPKLSHNVKILAHSAGPKVISLRNAWIL